MIDAETGKKVLRPAYFSSMNAMIEGALFSLRVFLRSCIKTGRCYCSISPEAFYFNLKSGAFHFEGEELLGEAYVQAPDARNRQIYGVPCSQSWQSALAEEQENYYLKQKNRKHSKLSENAIL
ncbi:MAG: hypothetical protein ACLRYY_12355 [Anaerobutyricum soehngenii]